MPWLSFALGGDGVCFVHDAEGFGFMVGAFVLMHNHNFFPSRFQYQEQGRIQDFWKGGLQMNNIKSGGGCMRG